MEQQATRDYPGKPLPIGVLVELKARMELGQATPEERQVVERNLVLYRTRYRQGNVSTRTARRLGLIDGEGKELSCEIGKG
jgi:hypothetical protein